VSLNKRHRRSDIRKVTAAIDVVVAWLGTGIHLKVQTVGMWIISTNIEVAWPKLECSFDGCPGARELSSGHKGSEVIDTSLDLPAGVDAWKALLPIDLHQGEVSKCFHSPVRFGEIPPSFQVKRERRLKRREGSNVLNPAGDLAQIEIFHAFGMGSEESFHPLGQIAGLVQNDQLTVDVENLVDGGTFGERGKGVFQKR